MSALYMVDTITGEQTLISDSIELAAVPPLTEVETEEIGVWNNDPEIITMCCRPICRSEYLFYLSLFYGKTITNNWLKRHGGVMSRKIHRRYRRE